MFVSKKMTWWAWVALTLAVFFAIFPIFWIISTAFKPSTEWVAIPPVWISGQPTLDNFNAVFISQADAANTSATSVSETGWPYVQFRGGPRGFLKALDETTLAYADYRGNRQYISVGNFDENNKVHLFLMDYPNRRRIKIWGEASIITSDEDGVSRLKDEDYEVVIERGIKIKITAWDVNCPQHITPRYTVQEIRPYLDKF